MYQPEQETSSHPVNGRALLAAVAGTFVAGAAEWVRAGTQPSEVAAEVARSFVVAYVLARLVARARVTGWKGGLALGAGVCVFQAFILLGSVLHEHKALGAFAVQGGYALASTLTAAAILGARGSAGDAPRPASGDHVNTKAVALAAVAAMIVGALWYSPLLFGGAWAHLKTGASPAGAKLSPLEGIGELVRSGAVAYVLARLVLAVRAGRWRGSIVLGGGMWLGFHSTLLLYSVIHEHMPLALFGVHAGHGLANDLVIAGIVGTWRARVKPDALAKAAATRAANGFSPHERTARP